MTPPPIEASTDAGPGPQDAGSETTSTEDAKPSCASAVSVRSEALLAHWSFDVSDDDCAGKLGPGTAQGNPDRVPGIAGMARRFDGVDDIIKVAGGAALTQGTGAQELTIAAWVRMPVADPATSGDGYTILCRGLGDDVNFDFRVWSGGEGNIWNDNLQTFWHDRTQDGWCGFQRPPDTFLPDGSWRFVASVLKWNQAHEVSGAYFQDGSLKAADVHANGADCSKTTPIDDPTGTLTLGGRAGMPEYFRGDLDEIRVWNIVLTDEELAAQQAIDMTTDS